MSVSTTYAANLSSENIVLFGELDDLHGEDSLLTNFEWGPTTAYGNETAQITNTALAPYFASISTSGLDDFHSTGNYYHYRAKATDGITTWYGVDRTFHFLWVLGEDPIVVDNEMTSGTIVNLNQFNNVLVLDYVNATKDATEFGMTLTGGSKVPVMQSIDWGMILSGGNKIPVMQNIDLAMTLTGGTIT